MAQPPIEQVHAKFRYDPETGLIYVRQQTRKGFCITRPVGSEKFGYLRLSMGRQIVCAHRVAWALHYGDWPEGAIDHIDRDRMNNRINNLRLATDSQNTVNSELRGAIPAKGVCWHKKDRKYRAQIKVARVGRHLGNFDTIDEAAHAYNKAAIKYHGEFALLNPIGQDKECHMQQPTDTAKGA